MDVQRTTAFESTAVSVSKCGIFCCIHYYVLLDLDSRYQGHICQRIYTLKLTSNKVCGLHVLDFVYENSQLKNGAFVGYHGIY